MLNNTMLPRRAVDDGITLPGPGRTGYGLLNHNDPSVPTVLNQ